MSDELMTEFLNNKGNMCIKNDTISDVLFSEYGVNRGLRDLN